jgi:hypothetical protein
MGYIIQYPGTDCGSGFRSIDPKLDQITYAPGMNLQGQPPLPDSPAVDAGDPAACLPEIAGETDILGRSRIVDGGHAKNCDIGAAEYNAAPLVLPTAVPNLTPSGTEF